MNYQQLLDYAKVLAVGGALTVRRLGQKADYDVDLLRQSIGNLDWYLSELSSTTLRGIRHALTLALGDAEDRAYNRRHRR